MDSVSETVVIRSVRYPNYIINIIISLLFLVKLKKYWHPDSRTVVVPVAILKSVRKAMPNDLKCACSPSPWQGWSSSHSQQSTWGFIKEALNKPTKSSKQFHAKGSKNEEQKEEEEAEIADLRQGLHDSVQQRANSFGHFQELEDPSNSENSHHADNGRVDREDHSLYFLQSYPHQGQPHYHHVQLVPPYIKQA